MSKFEEQIEKYKRSISKYNIDVSMELVIKVAKKLGPSIYKRDANSIACSSKKETQYVIDKFLKIKLGLKDSDKVLEDAIKEVCSIMGQSNPVKYRPIFYALLIEKFNKVDLY